jgi:hypothetical protein
MAIIDRLMPQLLHRAREGRRTAEAHRVGRTDYNAMLIEVNQMHTAVGMMTAIVETMTDVIRRRPG